MSAKIVHLIGKAKDLDEDQEVAYEDPTASDLAELLRGLS